MLFDCFPVEMLEESLTPVTEKLVAVIGGGPWRGARTLEEVMTKAEVYGLYYSPNYKAERVGIQHRLLLHFSHIMYLQGYKT